ncbi:MAG: hypothetical protein KDH19_03535, partial [Geminicoccaceae bacterium]|nr:hypothetical protein [Geminicoccaceae bacterium]
MRVTQIWTSIADAGRDLLRGRLTARRTSPEQLAADLLSTRGDAVGAALAHELVQQLAGSGGDTRIDFLRYLARSLEVDPARINEAAAGYAADPTAARLA